MVIRGESAGSRSLCRPEGGSKGIVTRFFDRSAAGVQSVRRAGSNLGDLGRKRDRDDLLGLVAGPTCPVGVAHCGAIAGPCFDEQRDLASRQCGCRGVVVAGGLGQKSIELAEQDLIGKHTRGIDRLGRQGIVFKRGLVDGGGRAGADPEPRAAPLLLAFGPGSEYACHGIGRAGKGRSQDEDGRGAIGGLGVALEVEYPGDVQAGHEGLLLDSPGGRFTDQEKQQELLRRGRLIRPGRVAVFTEQDRSGLPFMARAAQGGLEGGRWRVGPGDCAGCVRRGTGAGSGSGDSRLRSVARAGGRAGVEPG